MTCRELYLTARKQFANAGIGDPGTDSLLLAEAFLGLDRTGLALHGDKLPTEEQETSFLTAVRERLARRPLQYILGNWEFMGLTLKVGEGVLVPREDTAVAIEALAERISQLPSPVGLDLCAGTGAMALGLCTLLPNAEITCLELSDQAFSYLEQNLSAYPQYHVQGRKGNILQPGTADFFAPQSLDFILSNPPYIPTEQLASLQPEVQNEPSLALDGGWDGLQFYHAICSLWLPLLKPGGVLSVEIGEEQGETVSALFSRHSLTNVEVRRDWANLDRCVIGTMPS